MTNVETYQINMKLSGRMTQLPDSQKLFGALVYLYSEYASQEKTTEFVSKVKDGSIYVALSNLCPLAYFPVPQTHLLDVVAEGTPNSLDEKQSRKVIYKNIKKRQYVKYAQLEELLDDPKKAAMAYPYVCIKPSQQIHVAIDSLKYGLPGLEPNLYSVPEEMALEIGDESEEEKGKVITEFSFYLSIDSCEETTKLLYTLGDSIDQDRLFFLGSRASQGLNTFTVTNMTKLEGSFHGNAARYLNMGMLLPDKIDFEQSTLKLFTSERRPYHMNGGWHDKSDKKFVSFIEAGSIIAPVGGVKHAGHSIQSEGNAIIFGNSFLYPISM